MTRADLSLSSFESHVDLGSPASHDLSTGTPDLEHSAIIQQTQLEDPGPSISRCDGNIDVSLVHVECKPAISDYSPKKHQETGAGEGGKEHRCIHVERDLRRNDDINIGQTIERTSTVNYQQSDSLFYDSISTSFVTDTPTPALSSSNSQNITSHGIPRHVVAATFDDPVSEWHASTLNPEIVIFDSNLGSSVMNDRDLAYSDPAGYVVATTAPITSAMDDTNSAYADPSIYIVPATTSDPCCSETVSSPSMRPYGLHTTNLDRHPVDMSQRIDNAVNHQPSRLSEKDEELSHFRPSHLSSQTSRSTEDDKEAVTSTEPTQIIRIDTLGQS
ncbi:hypothetical protein AAF712_016108 [Marasmius tenuissimus]|uniref:Uncharacterized protein n=1 Tax=Marasmius tenuissimus TaxID=585030 RepID=A0ABR2Z8T0_9AGAR